MMKAFLSLTLLLSIVRSSISLAKKESPNENHNCRLYMAVSSTSTTQEPKWGMYAGVGFDEGVQLGEPDVAIEFHNLMAHAMIEGDDEDDAYEKKSLRRKTVELMERMQWVPDSSGASREVEGHDHVNALLPGTALLAAYNGKLTNAAFNHSSSYYRPAIGELSGKSHPGRGGSSHFFNVGMVSKQLIPTGFELFMDYGENFEDDDPDAKLHAGDFEKMDALIENMIEFLEKYKDELNTTAKREIYDFLTKDVMAAAAGPKKQKLIANILPENPDDLSQIKSAGGSFVYASPQVKRDLTWLQTEGFCMDNLVMGASTIPNAGRGAFARVFLKQGETIAPVPLLHVPTSQVVKMHKLDQERSYRTSDDIEDQQLFINYCLAHSESSMLFFPTGGLVPLINHSSQKPNAKFVWSKHPQHQSEWLEKKPADLAEEEYLYMGLLMELVATRDIEEGEEVLIDYGQEWQEAWDKHVEEWQKRVESGELPQEWPLRALDLNQDYHASSAKACLPFKMAEELETNPYPPNVDTHCFLYVKEADSDKDVEKPQPWGRPPMGTVYHTTHLYNCTIKERVELEKEDNGGMYNYTVVVGEEFPMTITGVPHQAVIFLDKPSTSDQFVLGAFRHPIGFPDEIFPKGPWRDLAAS